MNFPNSIPFPPQIALQSYESVGISQEIRRSDPRDHSVIIACYQGPDGSLRVPNDLHNPRYPEGLIPGVATRHVKLHHYPNDTKGYKYSVSDFIAAETLLADSPIWANPCLAVRKSDSDSERFIISCSEELLSKAIQGKQDLFHRPIIRTLGMDGKTAPETMVYVGMQVDNLYDYLCYAGSPNDISKELLEWFGHLWSADELDSLANSDPENKLHIISEKLNDLPNIRCNIIDVGNCIQNEPEHINSESPEPS